MSLPYQDWAGCCLRKNLAGYSKGTQNVLQEHPLTLNLKHFTLSVNWIDFINPESVLWSETITTTTSLSNHLLYGNQLCHIYNLESDFFWWGGCGEGVVGSMRNVYFPTLFSHKPDFPHLFLWATFLLFLHRGNKTPGDFSLVLVLAK